MLDQSMSNLKYSTSTAGHNLGLFDIFDTKFSIDIVGDSMIVDRNVCHCC
jgi:hypothetical protein